MSEQNFHVAIIGGGIGGLCLAQGLKKVGISVAVYERDETPTSRLQGFRIHIDPQGSAALHDCLPEELWRIFDSTEGDFSQGFTLMTEQLRELLRVGAEGGPVDPIARHRSISRITLRRVLLAGLGDVVRFGKRFVHYDEMADGRLELQFDDRSTAIADILVGADGVNSAVRKQCLPDSDPVDTGGVAFGGKLHLTGGILALVPSRLLDGPVMVVPPDPCSLFMAIWKRSAAAGQALQRLGIDEPPPGDENYLVLGFGGQAEYFGIAGDPRSLPARDLKETIRRVVAHWHPNLRKLAEIAEEQELSATPIRTSRPGAAWSTTRVTLLGDAIHSRRQYRSEGRDLALLEASRGISR